MAAARRCKLRRKRVGKVSCYEHHGAWRVHYKEGERQVRRRVGDQALAEQLAAQVNAQLATAAPTMFSFTPVTPPNTFRHLRAPEVPAAAPTSADTRQATTPPKTCSAVRLVRLLKQARSSE